MSLNHGPRTAAAAATATEELDPSKEERAGRVREVGNQAVWSLSSCKPGLGVQQLRDDCLDSYWQSDGPQPHLVNIQFRRKTTIQDVWIYANYKADESYTPSRNFDLEEATLVPPGLASYIKQRVSPEFISDSHTPLQLQFLPDLGAVWEPLQRPAGGGACGAQRALRLASHYPQGSERTSRHQHVHGADRRAVQPPERPRHSHPPNKNPLACTRHSSRRLRALCVYVLGSP